MIMPASITRARTGGSVGSDRPLRRWAIRVASAFLRALAAFVPRLQRGLPPRSALS